jgi:hypothetical protein
MTCILSSEIEDRYFGRCNGSETGTPLPDYPPPLLSLYLERHSTVDFPSSLKKEGVVPSETMGMIYQATQRYILEHSRRRENPNSRNFHEISQLVKWILVQWVSRKGGAWN